MQLTDLPTDVLVYLVDSSPRWTAWRLSCVSKTMRSLALPIMWRIQSIDVDKAVFLVENPSLAGLIRMASLIPSEFFGSDEDPPNDQLLYILVNLFMSFSQLRELTIPWPDHTLSFNLLAVPSSLEMLRFTHARPTVETLGILARTCPSLRRLEYSYYTFEHPIWIMTEAALDEYAIALTAFPFLEELNLCASVHQMRKEQTLGPPVFSSDLRFPEPNDLKAPESLTEDVVADCQRRATTTLAKANERLRVVVWSDLGTLKAWIWEIKRDGRMEIGDEYADGIQVQSKAIKQLTSKWDETYHQMRSYKQ